MLILIFNITYVNVIFPEIRNQKYKLKNYIII